MLSHRATDMDFKYLEQLKRTERSFEKLKGLIQGIPHVNDTESYRDDMYAFFMNCYHLKDWIQNDQAVRFNNITGVSKQELLEDFIAGNFCMLLCQSIATAQKHLTIGDKRFLKDVDTSKVSYNVIAIEGQGVILHARYSIEYQKKLYDSFVIATDCLELWRSFLMHKNLPISIL